MTRNETFIGLREFVVTAHYFELLATVNPVDIKIYGRDGVVLADDRQVESGYFHERHGLAAFERIEITTGGNEAVKWIISDGTSGNRKAADVIDRAARLLGIVYGALGQIAQAAIGGINALVTTPRGFIYGASYASTTAKAANTPDTVFSAAANVNGAIVWDARFISSISASSPTCAYLAKTSAPATILDGDPIVIEDFEPSTAGFYGGGSLKNPVFIAADKGLYYISTGGDLTTQRSVLYTLL